MYSGVKKVLFLLHCHFPTRHHVNFSDHLIGITSQNGQFTCAKKVYYKSYFSDKDRKTSRQYAKH